MKEYRILITPISIDFIDDNQICDHDCVRIYCPTCLTSQLPFYKDIRDYISAFIPAKKLKSVIVENVCHPRTHLNIHETTMIRKIMEYDNDNDYESNNNCNEKVNYYFIKCSDEFIFGFYSVLYCNYYSHSNPYWEKYKGKLATYRTTMYLKNIPSSTILLTEYNGHRKWFSTTDPESFINGWKIGSGIGSPINVKTYCKFVVPTVSTLTISDINTILSELRMTHINRLNECPSKCYRNIVKCPGCDDARLIGDVCNSCYYLLSNSSFEDMPCLQCS